MPRVGESRDSSNLPVAVPSRNSRRLATMCFTPRCCASGRIICSRAWLTRTTSAPAFNQLLYLLYSTRLQAWLELVVEIFLAQQVEAVSGDASQDGVHHARGKFAIGRVQKGRSKAIRKIRPRRRKRSLKV